MAAFNKGRLLAAALLILRRRRRRRKNAAATLMKQKGLDYSYKYRQANLWGICLNFHSCKDVWLKGIFHILNTYCQLFLVNRHFEILITVDRKTNIMFLSNFNPESNVFSNWNPKSNVFFFLQLTYPYVVFLTSKIFCS